MYDALAYYDTITIWLEGFDIVQFQVKIEREKLDLLPVSYIELERFYLIVMIDH